MKVLTLCLLLVGAAGSTLTHTLRSSLHHRAWDDYKAAHNKQYTNKAEHLERQKLFYEALARVDAHNALYEAGEVSHRLAINHLSDRRAAELRAWGLSKRHTRRAKVVPRALREAQENGHFDADAWQNDFELRPESMLPKNVDWREKGVVTPAQNQGGCGSCWAFAASEVLESAVAINNGTLTHISPQQLVSCMPNKAECGGSGGCQGATAELAFAYWMESDAVKTKDMAYTGKNGPCHDHGAGAPKPTASVGGWRKLPENQYLPVLNAIANIGPMVISVDASSWSGYSGGIFHDNSYDNDINHAVVLVGYGEENGHKYWLVRNSWGESWGEGGYIRLHRGGEEPKCGTDATPCDGTQCKGECHDAVKVCGESGILYDVSYPIGARLA